MSFLPLVFESAVAIVLALVAGLCWRLDRRLTALKSGQDGVRRTVIELAEATARAQASVKALKAAGDGAGRDLDEKLARARALADELSFLISKGSREDAARGARPRRPEFEDRAPRAPRQTDRFQDDRVEASPEARSERRSNRSTRAQAFAELLEDGDGRAELEHLRRRLKGVR